MIDAAKLFAAIRTVKGSALTQDDVDLINGVIEPQPFTGPRKIGAKGLALIKASEGLRLKAYPDPASGGDPWTIGYGSTKGVTPGMVITEARAEDMLRADVAMFESAVNRLCPVTTQNQFDALVSLAFNVGEGNLASSTLRKMHNAGNYTGAQAEFARWNKAAGKVMPGLVKRRAAEAQLYGSSAA